jgi:hypothetical protein
LFWRFAFRPAFGDFHRNLRLRENAVSVFARSSVKHYYLKNTQNSPMKYFLTTFLLLICLKINVFAQANADCVSAMEICKKQVYHIESAGGEGADDTEADLISCFMSSENAGQAEENSTWIRFEIAQSGSLTFAITPHRFDDDIDFVVYRLTDGTCKNKKIVRCNAAGDPRHKAGISPCLGETGLREKESDTSVNAGCEDAGDNAWLAPLQTVKGEKYALLISNVTSRGPGFSIRFGGSAMLPCDKPKTTKPKPPPVAKSKPTPPPATPPPVVAKVEKPTSIGGRAVEVGDELKVKSRKIRLKIWDSQVEDGDIVSVYLNDKKVIDHLYLRLKAQEFEIDLPPGREHYLTVYADDFGKAEPNTAMVSIFDGVREQTIDLVASRSKQESVRIVAE